MHFSTIIAALAPVSLISAYTIQYSKQYCSQTRTISVQYNANLGSCYNVDGAASYQFFDVASGGSWVCDAYSGSNCQGNAEADVSNDSNSDCNTSQIGWIYSFKCYLK
ncbi:hypothetical protein EsH8_X_000081 [Colletotrichum jinshuiense]